MPGGVLHAGIYFYKLVRQSQIVQSVTQDCKYVLSHPLPVRNLLVEGQFLFVKIVLKFTVEFVLNSLLH